MGLAEFEVRHSGRDSLDTDEKIKPKVQEIHAVSKRCESKKVQLTAKCRDEGPGSRGVGLKEI